VSPSLSEPLRLRERSAVLLSPTNCQARGAVEIDDKRERLGVRLLLGQIKHESARGALGVLLPSRNRAQYSDSWGLG